MWGFLILPVLAAGSLHDSELSALQEVLRDDRASPPEALGVDRNGPNIELERRRREEWTWAEHTYGLKPTWS